MVVIELLGVSKSAGGVAELDILELLGCLDHELLMTEAVGENNVAAFVNELCRCLVAGLILGDIVLENVLALAEAEVLAGFLCRVHEVEVIGGVLVMQENKSDLDVGYILVICVVLLVGIVAAGAQCKHHDQCQKHCSDLLHHLSVTLQNNLLSSPRGL